MSAKKSWDLVRREPKSQETAKPSPATPASRRVVKSAPQARQPMDMRRAPVKQSTASRHTAAAPRASTRDVEHPRGIRPQKAPRQPLSARRKKDRKRFFILLAVFVALIIAGIFYVLWLPILRIQEVQADGESASDLQAIAMHDMRGSYLFILPRSSIFVIPEKEIRAHILAAHPEIEALSISAKGVNTLVLHTVERASAFWWCGSDIATTDTQCYDTNAAGLIFEPATGFDASSTAMLRLYAPVDATTSAPSYPLGTHIQSAGAIPNALRFVKAIKGLGVNIVSLALRADEADLYTQNGTRITYVLGREERAADLAATAFPQLSLNDGSLEYVDLRFDGKVYFKRK